MKTKDILFSIAVAAAVLVSFPSCNDFLEVESQGVPSSDRYFTNEQQVIDAIKGLYIKMSSGDDLFGRELFWEQNGTGDLVFGRSRDYVSLASRDYTGDESPLRDCFKKIYEGIARSNYVVSSLLVKQKEQGSEFTGVWKRSLGEAYFMRGFFHLYAAYRYGVGSLGVPFVKYEDYPEGYNYEIPKQQASVCDNYKMVIEDFDKAEELLPVFEDYDAGDRGRAHKAAACAYKAKAYAYWALWDSGKWEDVITEVNKLEKEYGRGLAESYDLLYTHEVDKFWCKEYIWAITSRGGSAYGGCELPGVMWENKGWGKFNGWGQNKPTLSIYKEMAKDNQGSEKNDRLKFSILEYGDQFYYFGETRKFYSASDVESGFGVYKYQHAVNYSADPIGDGLISTNADFPTFTINFPLLRMADCILLRAEAYLSTSKPGKAATDINTIRKRANLKQISDNATWTDLYHERRCELAFEYSDHLYDLKRWAFGGDNEIKQLAIAELDAVQMVRTYKDRMDPASTYTETEYSDKSSHHIAWANRQLVFPYPSEQVNKSNGALKQVTW